MNDWIVPYFTFNGNCEEAVKFYQKVLGGELQIMRFGDAPPNPAYPIPEHLKNLVLHAELRKKGHVLRFADIFPNAPYTTGTNISFTMEFATKAETRAMFESLSAGGKVEMDLQETFFSPLYGKFTDQFGIMWQVVCEHNK